MNIIVLLAVLAAILHQPNAVEGRALNDGQGIRRLRLTRPVVNKSLNFTFVAKNTSSNVAGTKGAPPRQFVSKSAHIISGVLSSRGQFPWQAGMDIDNDFFCGGSLIALSYILTAAHCAHGSTKFEIVLGAQNRDVFEQGRQTAVSTQKVVHPKFNPDTLQNDVAIVTMPKQAVLGNFVKLIRLPPREHMGYSFVGTKGVVSGWGKTADTDDTVSSLQFHVPLNILTLEECMQVYGPSSIYRSNLCAAGGNDAATCQGDSGGPLVYKETDGAWTQIGVVSYGAATGCEMGYPDVFTRVTAYMGWIQTHVPALQRLVKKSGHIAAGMMNGAVGGGGGGGKGGWGGQKDKRRGTIIIKTK